MNESADNYNPNATCDAFCNFIADFNGDGAVNVSDLLLFTGGWSCSGDGCLGDLDNDNYVGSTDLLLFLSLFGEGWNQTSFWFRTISDAHRFVGGEKAILAP